jgi:predicted alpha/beta hydrolase family esterase
MKTAIILHGMPSKEEYFNFKSPSPSNNHWLPWLQHELILNDILAQSPELLEPYEPDYEKWRLVFERFPIDKDTYLIGHSCGGGFLVRWLSENKIQVGKVALVAPWINAASPRPKPGFFDFELDRNLVERTQGACLFVSTDDSQDIINTAKQLQENVQGIIVQEFSNKGHFTLQDMGTEVFPELRDFLIIKT